MPLSESEAGLLTRAKSLRERLGDWHAAQSITDPVTSALDAGRTPSDVRAVQHLGEFQGEYRARFSDEATSLWDDLTQMGITPALAPGEYHPGSRMKYETGTNTGVVRMVLEDLDRRIALLEVRR